MWLCSYSGVSHQTTNSDNIIDEEILPFISLVVYLLHLVGLEIDVGPKGHKVISKIAI